MSDSVLVDSVLMLAFMVKSREDMAFAGLFGCAMFAQDVQGSAQTACTSVVHSLGASVGLKRILQRVNVFKVLAFLSLPHLSETGRSRALHMSHRRSHVGLRFLKLMVGQRYLI